MIGTVTPGSPGGKMQCPSCGFFTHDDWKKLISSVSSIGGQPHRRHVEVPGPFDASIPRQDQRPEAAVELDWMVCANPKCHDLVIRMHETREDDFGELDTHTWTIRPRYAKRPIPREVEEPFRADYMEASALLDLSPRMSAVLSRKIVHDLIEAFTDITEFSLAKAIDRFNEDVSRPSAIRGNLHYMREIADFSAHTQRDKSPQDDTDQIRDDHALIIPVSRDDAEWSLGLVDRLFDYLIVGPAQDAALKETWNKNLEKAKRKPLAPPSDAQTEEPLS
jgi:hypothetical protein